MLEFTKMRELFLGVVPEPTIKGGKSEQDIVITTKFLYRNEIEENFRYKQHILESYFVNELYISHLSDLQLTAIRDCYFMFTVIYISKSLEHLYSDAHMIGCTIVNYLMIQKNFRNKA